MVKFETSHAHTLPLRITFCAVTTFPQLTSEMRNVELRTCVICHLIAHSQHKFHFSFCSSIAGNLASHPRPQAKGAFPAEYRNRLSLDFCIYFCSSSHKL